jgi:hypothetical protein
MVDRPEGKNSAPNNKHKNCSPSYKLFHLDGPAVAIYSNVPTKAMMYARGGAET